MSNTQKSHPHGRRTRLAWVVLVSWLGLSTLAMYVFVFADYGEFDPHQQWLGWQPPEDIGEKLSLADDNDQWSIVHVRGDHCSCNSYLNTHLEDLTRDHAGVAQLDASIDSLDEYGFIVPATPMAMIFQGQQLVYAGPYASGPFCASEDSLISDLLEQRTQLAGTYLQGLVKACRCLS